MSDQTRDPVRRVRGSNGPSRVVNARHSEAAEKPNLLVIVSDTLRRDHLGAYGNDWIHTPHLDAFAETAVVFDQYRAGSFPTMPARADLLTAKLAFTFMGWQPLPRTLQTLPELLAASGYSTAAVVDTPFFVRNGFGYDRGFQDFLWIRGQATQPPNERHDTQASWRTEGDRFVARTITTAEEWLERHYRERFFLYVDTWDPHEPWDAPAWYTRLYLPDFDGRAVGPCYGKWSERGLTAKDVEIGHATYCGEVTMVDRWIGSLLEKVELLGLTDSTVIVFLSDHGFYFGEHGYFGKASWESWELRAQAWSPLYSELSRIPLMIREPGATPGRRDALATAVDLPATLLDLAGAARMQESHGQSLVPAIRGQGADQQRRFIISSWPLMSRRGSLSSAVDSVPRRVTRYMPVTISTREWTLLVGGPDDAPDLYDVNIDPAEETNVWLERQADGLELLREALDYLEQLGTAEEMLAPARDVLNRLRAAAGR